jgi:hypothetical protein
MPIRPRALLPVLGVLLFVVPLLARAPQHFPVAEIRPGMVAHGETVFAGSAREPFTARIIGVVENMVGPHRRLILARLEGGPLASTGVIAGMSGSPVFIDGRLVGAVAYSLGQFSKEPIAGITPIGEMIALASQGSATPAPPSSGPVRLPVDEGWLLDDLRVRLGGSRAFADRAADVRVVAGRGTAEAAALRRIATPLSLTGYSERVAQRLGDVLGAFGLRAIAGAGGGLVDMPDQPLSGGDAIGVNLVSGDFSIAATGTVTLVDGRRVFAFGHPLVGLGPVSLPMTRAYVHTVLPSLLDSFKITSPGPVIGTLDQDRSTAIAGMLGAGPSTIPVSVTLTSERAEPRRFAFEVAREQALTPTMAFFTVLQVLQSYEREIGGSTVGVRGSVRVKGHGAFELNDMFAGETAAGSAVGYVATPLALLARTDIARVEVEGIDLHIAASERPRTLAIERVWLDSARVRAGDTVVARVALRPWRGAEVVRAVPIQVPANAKGALTLVVADATRIAPYDTSDLRQVTAFDTVPQLMRAFASLRRNTVMHVRLVDQEGGAQISGEALPSLPPSVMAVVEADRTGAGAAPLRYATVGAWDIPADGVVVGQRIVTITIESE